LRIFYFAVTNSCFQKPYKDVSATKSKTKEYHTFPDLEKSTHSGEIFIKK